MALPFSVYDGSLPAWFALAPVLWLVASAKRRREALACSAAFSLCWTGVSFSFLWHLAAPGMVALCFYSSAYYVTALMTSRWLWQRGAWQAVFGTAAFWAFIEILRARVPVFGFPWLLLGHTLLYSEWLRQGADVLGVFGLSFLIAATNAALAFAWGARQQQQQPPADAAVLRIEWRFGDGHQQINVLGFLLLTLAGYGAWRVHSLEPLLQAGPPIAVIQGNILQKLGRTAEELTAQVLGHNALHREVVEKARADGNEPVLVCWAETMVPGSLNTDDEWGKPFREQVAALGLPTLAGSNFTEASVVAKGNGDPSCYNAAYLLDGHGKELLHYYKRRLVPFGEYIPFTTQLAFMKSLRSFTRDQYIPGSAASPIFSIPLEAKPGDANSYRIGLNICVEDIHPDLAREAVRDGADALVNITNDGWFYGTCGPRSHMQAAVWRAIETRRPLLRVTNTGHTVAVDPLGRMDVLLPPWTVGTAIVRLKRITEGGVPVATMTCAMWLGEVGSGVFFLGFFVTCAFLGKFFHNPRNNKDL